MSGFQQQQIKHTKKQENRAYSEGKNKLTENHPWENSFTGLARQRC